MSESAVVTQRATISAGGARRALDAGVAKAQELEAPSVVAVVDAAGILVTMVRMDGAPLIGADLAARKAHTSIMLGGADTGKVADMVNKDPGRAAALSSVPGISMLAGGVPIVVDELVVGAVAVSSSKGSVDGEIAAAAAAALADPA